MVCQILFPSCLIAIESSKIQNTKCIYFVGKRNVWLGAYGIVILYAKMFFFFFLDHSNYHENACRANPCKSLRREAQ